MYFFFFFNDTATTEIYTLSLHDALPIYIVPGSLDPVNAGNAMCALITTSAPAAIPARNGTDRKSTRLNSSHLVISYAVFCLKKKKNKPDLVYPAIHSQSPRLSQLLRI